MILTVNRDLFSGDFTMSEWQIDGVHECFGVEDTDRFLESGGVKVYAKTAIPRGTYNCIISYSPRFKRDLPLLIGVKGFDGVRIHPGNSAADTEGCLLPGLSRDDRKGVVFQSRMAFTLLFEKMKKAYDDGDDLKVEIK